uniref:Even-skipped homeobox 1 n=1 Tax=Anser brachyrhynchus TaxID=132585 RepID=A0A8B9BYA2_9AVES
METRKEMVMFLEGTQLGALVGKRVPNLSETVGSPAQEPQEKMIHRNCLSPRPGPLSSRERGGGGGGGGGEDEEEVEVLPGTGTVPESRSAAAALLSAGQQPPAPEQPSSKGQQSSSDTESDFYEEIEVSCTPDCATGSAEYQHSKGTQLLPMKSLPILPTGGVFSVKGVRGGGEGEQDQTGFLAKSCLWFCRVKCARASAEAPIKTVKSLADSCLPKERQRGPCLHVWFQNRRMKDKRQRLAMTWPHPADPAFYTYMMSHAAATGNLPYPFPSHLPLPYYSHMGIGATSASAATPFNTPLRPLDTFRVLSHPYPRPELLCAFRHPSLYPAPSHGLSSAGGNPCSCLACHGSQSNGLAQRPSGSDFTCSATTRTDSFLTFTPSVLSKATSVSMDQREEVPLTR